MFRSRKFRIWVSAIAAGLFCAFAVLWFGYRPWALNWGATEEEISRAMPGDSIVPAPTFNATRGITIDAAPADIWPWMIQIGYRRAGFYSYDRLDNDGIPSSDTIMPRYQRLSEGDAIPLTATVDAEVVQLERERAMLLVIEHDGTWTWVWCLYPTGMGQTRLVTRLRVRAPTLRSKLMMDFFEIIMMRKHLLGIKRRAESRRVIGQELSRTRSSTLPESAPGFGPPASPRRVPRRRP